jgi:hypothetical protein
MWSKKQSDTLVIGIPKLANWCRFFTTKDQKRMDFLNKLNKDIPATLIEIAAKEIK